MCHLRTERESQAGCRETSPGFPGSSRATWAVSSCGRCLHDRWRRADVTAVTWLAKHCTCTCTALHRTVPSSGDRCLKEFPAGTRAAASGMGDLQGGGRRREEREPHVLHCSVQLLAAVASLMYCSVSQLLTLASLVYCSVPKLVAVASPMHCSVPQLVTVASLVYCI